MVPDESIERLINESSIGLIDYDNENYAYRVIVPIREIKRIKNSGQDQEEVVKKIKGECVRRLTPKARKHKRIRSI